MSRINHSRLVLPSYDLAPTHTPGGILTTPLSLRVDLPAGGGVGCQGPQRLLSLM